ncbi:hypothetical protein GQ44DRAFT_697717 [Phaeosphaeriaceae sp. PMI808]|nr:hypothetical protein GQ44DRAFT_697717 [Phaeosphaeriaceae sp. PMI808]
MGNIVTNRFNCGTTLNDASTNNMTRNQTFQPVHQPLKDCSELHLEPSRVSGPLHFLNPTKAHYRHDARPDIRFKWTSRNNRKGRHAIVVHAADTKPPTLLPTSSPLHIARSIWRMLTYYPIWDISFDVAYMFTIGSVIWVINAFFVWLPLVRPDTVFSNEELYGGGITAFIGATVFEIGSILLWLEAINENKAGCFGWAVEQAFAYEEQGEQEQGILRPSYAHCTHHHSNKRSLIRSEEPTKDGRDANARSWVWWPSTKTLRTDYIHSLGFLASLSQLMGATIFWISGLTALPGIYNHMSRPISIVFYWAPQIFGGLGFIVSGTLFMLETQPAWWKPAPKTLGWWIGAWNLIGGVGFTICPAFGLDESSWAQYQACLSTFWGSWAFLIGSTMQWYESLEKFPVEMVSSSSGGKR